MVTSSLCEVLRISTPHVPYDDDTMKKVLGLMVESFQGLDDVSTVHASRRFALPKIFAEVRVSNLRLDLGLQNLILSSFEVSLLGLLRIE